MFLKKAPVGLGRAGLLPARNVKGNVQYSRNYSDHPRPAGPEATISTSTARQQQLDECPASSVSVSERQQQQQQQHQHQCNADALPSINPTSTSLHHTSNGTNAIPRTDSSLDLSPLPPKIKVNEKEVEEEGKNEEAHLHKSPSPSYIKEKNQTRRKRRRVETTAVPPPSPPSPPKKTTRTKSAHSGDMTNTNDRNNDKKFAAKKSSTTKADSKMRGISDVLRMVVEVPGKVFSVDDPNVFYTGYVVKRDPTRKRAVEVIFRDDQSRYWFPIGDVRQWLIEQQNRNSPLNKENEERQRKRKMRRQQEQVTSANTSKNLVEESEKEALAAQVLTEISGGGGVTGSGGMTTSTLRYHDPCGVVAPSREELSSVDGVVHVKKITRDRSRLGRNTVASKRS